VLANDEREPNGFRLFVVDGNNEDVAKEVVLLNKDGEVLAENVETLVGPNIVVLVDDVNGLELATVLLNEVLNGEPGLGANGLFVGIAFGVG
jgi:hypothetical protein